MKYKNKKDAELARRALATKLSGIYSQAAVGNDIDLMKVTDGLEGDEPRRAEVMMQLNKELADIGDEVAFFNNLESGRTTALDLIEGAGKPANDRLIHGNGHGVRADRRSLGAQFVDSAEFKAAVEPFNGHVPDNAQFKTNPVQMGSGLMRNVVPSQFRNDLMTSGQPDTDGGAFVVPDFTQILAPLPLRLIKILDLITMGTTQSDTVEFVRTVSLAQNAAGVAESTSTVDPDVLNSASGVKPESGMEFERVQTLVQNIAHWIPATKRALADASQVRTLIDNFLQAGLREELENQVVGGSGTGEQIEGFDTALTLDQPYSATVTDLNPVLETTRKALTKVQLARGITPSAFLFHPTDWEAVELARIVKNPWNDASAGGNPMLHGYPVVWSEACPQGFAYVGDFKQYVVWNREQSSIAVSDSHANFFIRNMVAILAEMRAAGALIRTDAICRIDLTA